MIYENDIVIENDPAKINNIKIDKEIKNEENSNKSIEIIDLTEEIKGSDNKKYSNSDNISNSPTSQSIASTESNSFNKEKKFLCFIKNLNLDSPL